MIRTLSVIGNTTFNQWKQAIITKKTNKINRMYEGPILSRIEYIDQRL